MNRRDELMENASKLDLLYIETYAKTKCFATQLLACLSIYNQIKQQHLRTKFLYWKN